MKGLIVALQFLTRLPTPRITVSSEEFAASMRWFPAAGLIVGAIVAAGGWTGPRSDPRTGAHAALIVWVAVTGALYLAALGAIPEPSGEAHQERARLLCLIGHPHLVGSTCRGQRRDSI